MGKGSGLVRPRWHSQRLIAFDDSAAKALSERRTMKANNPFHIERQRNSDANLAATEFRGGWLHGTVAMIEPSRDFLFLRAQETRKKLFIHWGPETQFTIDGHPGSSTDLRLGHRVRLHCKLMRDELEADNIAIEPSDYRGTTKPRVIPLRPKPRLNQGRKGP